MPVRQFETFQVTKSILKQRKICIGENPSLDQSHEWQTCLGFLCAASNKTKKSFCKECSNEDLLF